MALSPIEVRSSGYNPMDARTNELPLESEYEYSDGNHSPRSSARPSIGATDILETLRRSWRFPLYGFLIGLALAAAYFVMVPTPTRVLHACWSTAA